MWRTCDEAVLVEDQRVQLSTFIAAGQKVLLCSGNGDKTNAINCILKLIAWLVTYFNLKNYDIIRVLLFFWQWFGRFASVPRYIFDQTGCAQCDVHIVTWCWQFALQLSCVGLITATLWPVTMWQSGGATLCDHRRYCGLGPNTGDSAHYVKVAVYRYVYFGMGPNTASHHIINYDKVAGRHYVIIGDIATKHWWPWTLQQSGGAT